MASFNKVILVGNLTRDPEMRTTPSGVACTTFTVACQRRFANQQGVREADFISCVAWRQTAEFICKNFVKGRMIAIVGSLQTRNYDKDGQKHFITEVNVEEVYFTGDRGNDSGTAAQTASAPSSAAQPFDFSNMPVPDGADDLPF